MTKAELIKKLEALQEDDDTEQAHAEADEALIEFIDDEDVEKAYRAILKWYA